MSVNKIFLLFFTENKGGQKIYNKFIISNINIGYLDDQLKLKPKHV
jgi:hypothetical protein